MAKKMGLRIGAAARMPTRTTTVAARTSITRKKEGRRSALGYGLADAGLVVYRVVRGFAHDLKPFYLRLALLKGSGAYFHGLTPSHPDVSAALALTSSGVASRRRHGP